MPLTLVTGPANAGKAGRVLGAYRERIADEPVLVVPALRDVRHAQRELAARGAVFGTRVVRFAWLFEIAAERCGTAVGRDRHASRGQRDLLVEHAIATARLDALAEPARRPGFARAAGRFFAELGRSMVDPPRLWQALRAWTGDGPRRAVAEEMGALYAAYRHALDSAGLVDEPLFAQRTLDALRAEPARWGGSAVFVYGFDDFTPLELELLELLAGPAGAEVMASLPYEPHRAAFEAIRPSFERLAATASRHEALEPTSEHYAPESRVALHHVYQDKMVPPTSGNLFEPSPERPDPGGAVRLLRAGGERAEVELVAGEVLGLLRGGTRAGEIAVVFREPARYASLVTRVFTAYGIPFSLERWVPLAHTGLGRGALALLRCATGSGTADDLVAYLRTPGRLDQPHLADTLESEVRRTGLRTAADARRLWEERNWPLPELDRLAVPSRISALCHQLDEEVERLFARPYRRQAHLFGDDEVEDPAAREALRRALRDIRDLARLAPGLAPPPARFHDHLAEVRVRLGSDPAPDRVQVARPEDVRARRFQALFVCGLQEGEFPRPARYEPFLSDDDRRELRAATGLALPLRDDRPERERYLFYACASRAERLLALGWRETDEEGAPQVRSWSTTYATRSTPIRSTEACAHALWPRLRGPPTRRPPRRSGAGRWRSRGRTCCRRCPSGSIPRRCSRTSPRATACPLRRSRRTRTARSSGWSSACSTLRPSSPTPSRSCAGATRTRCSSSPTGGWASARGHGGSRRRTCRRPRRSWWRRSASARMTSRSPRRRCASAQRCAGSSSTCCGTSGPRRTPAGRSSPPSWRWSSGCPGRSRSRSG